MTWSMKFTESNLGKDFVVKVMNQICKQDTDGSECKEPDERARWSNSLPVSQH